MLKRRQLILLKQFDKYIKSVPSDYRESHFFNNFSKLELIGDRTDYLVKTVRKKKVLHIGFVDSPYTEEKALNSELLHQRMQEVASYTWGIDYDAELIKTYCTITKDKFVSSHDIQQPILLPNKASKYFDWIILGEVLEHIPSAGVALRQLSILAKKTGAKLIVTVPNAFFIGGVAMALEGFEGVHPDHKYYFSPKTLKAIVEENGFVVEKLQMYSDPIFDNRLPAILANGIVAVCRAE